MTELLARVLTFVLAILAGEAVEHPLIYTLWAGPVRLAYLYPQTVEGQTRALIDLNTVGLCASITTALVVYCLLRAAAQRLSNSTVERTGERS